MKKRPGLARFKKRHFDINSDIKTCQSRDVFVAQWAEGSHLAKEDQN